MAKVHQGQLEWRITAARTRSDMVRTSQGDEQMAERITHYSRVHLRPSEGTDLWVQLVPPSEVDLEAGRISVESPLGRALLGRTAGETVKVETPQGISVFEVLRVKCAIEQSCS